jgi:iron(III) transport system ATP-binding protein
MRQRDTDTGWSGGAPAGVSIALRGIVQRFGATRVLDGIDLDVPAGEVLALLGPSGCGKSTLLKLLAGLQAPTEGQILFDGQVVADARRQLAPEKRGLGMVFQDYALWPHMSVAQNVAFPLQMQGVPRKEQGARVDAALARVGLGALGRRRPGELSGGQQQRAALARAIVHAPPHPVVRRAAFQSGSRSARIAMRGDRRLAASTRHHRRLCHA